jgi:acyl-CoA thioester hydrolase
MHNHPTRTTFPELRDVPTRWHDNDHYGHVNNVVYYAYFDTAVNGWLLEVSGQDIRELPAIGLVLETSCRYYRPIGFPDQLQIGLGIAKLGRSSVIYRLAVFSEGSDEPAALGRFVHVYVDNATRQTAAIPDELRTAMASLHERSLEPFSAVDFLEVTRT